MMRTRFYVGVDPDVKESGISVWDSEEKRLTRVECMRFSKVLELIQYSKEFGDAKWVVDAGWLNKSNFHARADQSHRVSAQIGERTGANHQVGKLIAEICEDWGIPVELHRPTRSKVDADAFKKLTGYTDRINQEARDAAMLVYGI